MNATCYHVRECGTGNKLLGGSLGMSQKLTLDEAADKLSREFDVVVQNSGTPVFVDRSGRRVYIYLTLDPRDTDKGREALKAHYAEKDRLDKEYQAKEDELEALLGEFSTEEAIRILSGTLRPSGE